MNADGGGEGHVGPPRMLEIQNFAAARCAEVQALYKAVRDQVESSGGDPASLTVVRHLRRRTTSHNRRLPYWILNERKKTREGHASQARKKTKKNEIPHAPGSSEKRKVERPLPSRRVRRRIEFQRVRQGQDIVQRDGTRRLATHVWHAKRFPMTRCWGYSLPEGLPGRGRGSRAVLKWVDEAAVLHDASYYGLIELQGTSEAIARSLQDTVEPAVWFPNSGSPLKKAVAHGLLSGSAVLHQFGKAPYDAIAPVTFLWRPPSSSSKLRSADPEQAQADVAPDERQLWIWVHPGAYESALQCLSAACEKQEDNGKNAVKCRSRRSEFARLEILGSEATEVIRKVIHPTSRKFGIPRYKTTGQLPVRDSDSLSPGYPTDTDGDSGQPRNGSFFSKAEFLPPSAVLALDVLDPRVTSSYSTSVLKAEGGVGDDATRTERHQSVSETQVNDADVLEDPNQNGDGRDCLLDNEDGSDYSDSWLSMGERGLSREVSDSELWNLQAAQSTWLTPMSEKTLSQKRHQVRTNFLLGVNEERTANSAESFSKDQLNTSSVCPVLLLRSSKSMSSIFGWTIIMPMRWVHAFWVPLVFAGGRVIGVRERHWLATNAGTPHFPHDFPDCSAYAQLLAANVAASEEANRKRPPAKRGPCSVRSPLQASILTVFEANSRSSGSGSVKGDEHSGSRAESESIVSRSFCTQSSEKTSVITAGEKLISEVEQPYDASGKVAGVERYEERPSRDSALVQETVSLISQREPIESRNVDNVVLFATDNVIMIQGSRSLIPDGGSLENSQSCRGTEQALLHSGDSDFRPQEAGCSEARLEVSQPDSPGDAVKVITNDLGRRHGENSPRNGSVRGSKNRDRFSVMEEYKTRLSGGFSANLALESARTDSAGAVERLPTNDAMTAEFEDSDIKPASVECEGLARGNTFRRNETMDCIAENDKYRTAHSDDKNMETRSLAFFVARTQKTLRETFDRSGFQHALFLHQGITAGGTTGDSLRQETVRWSALQGEASKLSEYRSVCASVNGEEKVCYVRVLVSVPRRGVMEEGAVIFLPSEEDCDTFFRSKDWQGPSVVNPRNVKRKSQGKGKKVEVMSLDDDASHGTVEGTNGTYENADALCEAWSNNRKSIGLITSAIPRGSTSPCIGICEVGALVKLRAAQSGYRRDLFVLAGNKYSSKLRPTFLSLPLERTEDDIEWL